MDTFFFFLVDLLATGTGNNIVTSQIFQTMAMALHGRAMHRERCLFAFCILAVSTYNCPAQRKTTKRCHPSRTLTLCMRNRKPLPFLVSTAQARKVFHRLYLKRRSSYSFQRRCQGACSVTDLVLCNHANAGNILNNSFVCSQFMGWKPMNDFESSFVNHAITNTKIGSISNFIVAIRRRKWHFTCTISFTMKIIILKHIGSFMTGC